MTSTPPLPVELTDRIIDLLYYDHDSLRRCAISCREFLPRCRFNRFHSVHLNGKNIVQFTNILQSSPDISFYVRELVVMAKERMQRPGMIRPCISWIEIHLSKLGGKLSYVHKLEVLESDALREVAFRSFNSVQTLVLRRCNVSSVDRYIRFLNSFPSIRAVHNYHVGITKPDVVSQEATFVSLASIEFLHCSLHFSSLLGWLSSQSHRFSLETLAVGPIDYASLPPVGELLKAAAKTLEHICIYVTHDEDEDGSDVLQRALDLTSLTKLQTVIFGSTNAIGQPLFPANDAVLYPWISNALETITSSHLFSITFSLGKYEDSNTLENAYFNKLSLLLSSAQFKALREVRLSLVPAGRKAEMVSKLRGGLSRLGSNEKLVLDIPSNYGESDVYPSLYYPVPPS